MEKLPSILLVDDDDTSNFLHQHLLDKLGVAEEVRTVPDGAQALALLTQPVSYAPTLLLLDVKMPVMSGIEFLEAYRHLPQAQQDATVVVMLTTSMAAADLARINELPIAGLVSKPLNRDKINTLLQLHFHRQLPRETE